MTIKANVYGGTLIKGIILRCGATYNGVSVELRGHTIVQGAYKDAACVLEMSPSDALDMALVLINAAGKHGEQTISQVQCLVKRLAKKATKTKPNT